MQRIALNPFHSFVFFFSFPDDQMELLERLIASGSRVGLAMEQVEILKANVEVGVAAALPRLFMPLCNEVAAAACL
jgi:hypothetical protein